MVKLNAPWMEYYKQVEYLFKSDGNVVVTYDDNAKSIEVKVYDRRKADALKKLFPEKKVFGNIELVINVVYAGKTPEIFDTIYDAFKDNPIFCRLAQSELPATTLNYAIFTSNIVQYYADNISDVYGNHSMLSSDLVKAVFGDIEGVNICVDNAAFPIRTWSAYGDDEN